MVKKTKTNVCILSICLIIVLVYILLTDIFSLIDPFLFPSLKVVLPAFIKYLPQLIDGLISSLTLLVPSYFAALVLGILLGIPIGLVRNLRQNISPFINAASAIPATLLTPYAIYLLPTFRSASMFIIFIGSFWTILGATINAVMTIDKRYLEVADTLEIEGMERIIKVILPGASPTILSGSNIALKFSFLLLTVAEMFGATSGM